MESSVREFVIENPGADYNAIVSRFGTPKRIASAYVDDMDTGELLLNLRIRRKIVQIVVVTALLVITAWAGVMIYTINHNEQMVHGYGVVGEIEVIESTQWEKGN